MGAYLSLLPKGFKGEPYRRPTAPIFACAEGKGKTIIDGKPYEWGVNDVFVVPSWKTFHHEPAEESVLFFDFRQAGPGSARHLARRELITPRLGVLVIWTAAPLAARLVVMCWEGCHAVRATERRPWAR